MSSEDSPMVKQVESVFDRHIKLYQRLNAIKVAENLEDDRVSGQRRAILDMYSLWLAERQGKVSAA